MRLFILNFEGYELETKKCSIAKLMSTVWPFVVWIKRFFFYSFEKLKSRDHFSHFFYNKEGVLFKACMTLNHNAIFYATRFHCFSCLSVSTPLLSDTNVSWLWSVRMIVLLNYFFIQAKNLNHIHCKPYTNILSRYNQTPEPYGIIT